LNTDFQLAEIKFSEVYQKYVLYSRINSVELSAKYITKEDVLLIIYFIVSSLISFYSHSFFKILFLGVPKQLVYLVVACDAGDRHDVILTGVQGAQPLLHLHVVQILPFPSKIYGTFYNVYMCMFVENIYVCVNVRTKK
jgi:hypothetical protein